MKPVAKRWLIGVGIVLTLAIVVGVAGYRTIVWMPGDSVTGALPTLTEREARLREVLRQDIEALAERIGERHVGRYTALCAAADYIEQRFESSGYSVTRQGYDVAGRRCDNLIAQIDGTGRPDEVVILGAHYDSIPGCPAANDNASGVAALLALASACAGIQPDRTLRFVAFVNEESPHAMTPAMGSVVYAQRCKQQGDNVVAMISLETMGYFSDEPDSQAYPFPFSWFYPSTGNFIGFVGNLSSRHLVRRCVSVFRRHGTVPSQGAALPSWLRDANRSDHWSFWQQGFDALMVTDTAPFRYPYYHTPQDTVDKIDYGRLARVVAGLQPVAESLATY